LNDWLSITDDGVRKDGWVVAKKTGGFNKSSGFLNFFIKKTVPTQPF
jgi:hypothetical protein